MTHDNINPNEAKVQQCQAHCTLHRISLVVLSPDAAQNAVHVVGLSDSHAVGSDD